MFKSRYLAKKYADRKKLQEYVIVATPQGYKLYTPIEPGRDDILIKEERRIEQL